MPVQKIDSLQKETEVRLEGIGKKYAGRWIFRNINAVFGPGSRVAVTGPNGSGKSTLLQIISGFVSPAEGNVIYKGKTFSMGDQIDCAIAAPYLDLPEELTLKELLEFYFSFRKERIPVMDCITQCRLGNFMNQQLKGFSSGMKQKVKLSLVFSSDTGIYIFDEPCSHIDEESVGWYHENFSMLPSRSVVFVGSNSVKSEIQQCNQIITLG